MLMFAGIADASDLIARPNFAASAAAIAGLKTGLVDLRLVFIPQRPLTSPPSVGGVSQRRCPTTGVSVAHCTVWNRSSIASVRRHAPR